MDKCQSLISLILILAGMFLIMDGIMSIIYYAKSSDWLPHIGRVIRTGIGIFILWCGLRGEKYEV